ncbi:YqiA/YcfP family alpha/beta fold hydrolase [Thalassotalea crassostreae]|uniref:YqiA/YcfP family alpha/beta fold hydrolase n=1 Tax=Thalassotalea crassostreae TaxID=1763536 RepID=UPI000838807F|nr:YqiA/YcfP family alpha/beta fold hydrolase [Thalassotalea crassostreae]
MKQKVLVLHGFNSSPLSFKAQLLIDYINANFPNVDVVCPQLMSDPINAIEQITDIIEQDKNCSWYVTGSSLGGYFANYLVDKFKIPAVLINPAVKPYEILTDVIGPQTNPYTDEHYIVTEQHLQQLKEFERDVAIDDRYLVLVQTGDEVLDYRQAVEKYENYDVIVQRGGDHSFIDFDKMLPDIVKFFQLENNGVSSH